MPAFDDFLIFGSSFASGQLLAGFGWPAVNEVIFPAVFIAGGLVVWLKVYGCLSRPEFLTVVFSRFLRGAPSFPAKLDWAGTLIFAFYRRGVAAGEDYAAF